MHWSDEEDTLLISYIANNHVGSWSCISRLLRNRSPQQCFRRAFLLLGHETAFRFDSFLQVKGASAPKLNVRINPQNLMNLENPHSKSLTCSKNGDKLKKEKSSAIMSKKKKSKPLIVSGAVVKKPRHAFYEWIEMTGQHDILKRQFPEYNPYERRKHLRKLWNELPDAEKAPYILRYKKKYEGYKALKSKAENSEDTGENSLEEPSKKASGACGKNKAPLVVSV